MPQITSSSPQTPTAPSPSSTLAPINRNSTSPLNRADPHFLLRPTCAKIKPPSNKMTPKTRALLLLTATWFIAAAALGTRLAFTYNQQRKIPHQLLSTVPFEQETGNIAFALSQGRGFSNLFRQNTGPTAWIPPVYPLLTNPSLGIALPFLLFWAAVRARDVVQLAWRIPVCALLLIILCCLPWTIRNYAIFHRIIPIRSSLPFELWIGNNDIFDPHAINGTQRITRFEETRRYAQLGESAYLSDKQIRAITFIRQKPALFLHLTGRKIIATWIGTEHPIDDFLHANSLLVRIVILCNAILTLGTALGAVLLASSKNPFAFPLVIFPALFPLIYYVTHPSLRYRHPIDPILILLAVIAFAACVSKLHRNTPTLPSTS